jgi:hypothetical protein
MSQASAIRPALPTVPAASLPTGSRKLWKGWQIAYVIGRTVFLIGFFLLMEHRHGHDTSLLLSTSLGNKMFVQALMLLAIGTFFEMVLFALLNWWEAKQPASGVIWRVAAVMGGEALLWLFCFLPVFYVMFLGPAAVEIMNTLSHN